VATDDHSRVSFARIHPKEYGETACRFVRDAVAWFASRSIKIVRVLTDNGSPFRSRSFHALCVELGIKQKFTRPYTPTNGQG
jgi:transposase InsO family protein